MTPSRIKCRGVHRTLFKVRKLVTKYLGGCELDDLFCYLVDELGKLLSQLFADLLWWLLRI